MEALLLSLYKTRNIIQLFLHVRIEILHDIINDRNQLIHKCSLNVQLLRKPYCTAQNTAQYIASALIGEQRPICQRKAYGSDVIGNHAECHFMLGICITRIGIRFCRMDDWQKQVCIKIGFSTLYQRNKTFQSHTGINVFLRQLLVILTVKLRLTVKL